MSDPEEDVRATKPGICRITRKFGNTEFICIRPVHDAVYHRRSSDRNHRVGEPFYSNNVQVEKHWFVNR